MRTSEWKRDAETVTALAGQEGLQVFFRHPSTEADVLARLRCDGAFPQAEVGIDEASVQREAAAHGVRALLCGLGGDHAISSNGRAYYAELLLSGRWAAFFSEARARGSRHPLRLAAGTALRLLPHGHRLLIPRNRWRKWRQGDPVPWVRHFANPAFVRERRFPPRRRHWPTSERNAQLKNLGSRSLHDALDSWAASGVRHGLEYRYPLLDRRVLEFALSLPPEQFRRGPWGRWLMRHALDLGAVLPSDVCWRRLKTPLTNLTFSSGTIIGALASAGRELAARTPPPGRPATSTCRASSSIWRIPALSGNRRFQQGLSRALLLLDF